MRKITVILAASLLVLSACDKRDLSSIETRLDNLENGLENAEGRISTIEQTIAQINMDIESLQYLKSGLVVNSVSGSDAAGWKITFANGKVVTVWPKDASTTVPVISVSEDGYWTVDYLDGNGPQYLKDAAGERIAAVSVPGESGKDGIIPVLGADADGYWTVSYDGGETFALLLDESGNPVRARVTSGDSIFSGVVAGSTSVTFSLNSGESFSCPIVAEFLCAIKGVEDEVEFDAGETKTFEVEMKGISNAIVMCPSGWRAVLDGSTLTVIAPAATKGEAISYDSSFNVSILATSTQGYAVIAGFAVSIYVPAPSFDTYYEMWTGGAKIKVGTTEISPSKLPYSSMNPILIESDTNMSEVEGWTNTNNVWFIAEGATLTIDAAKYWNDAPATLYIIGNKVGTRSKVVWNNTLGPRGGAVVLKNIDIISSRDDSLDSEGKLSDYLIVDGCRIVLPSGDFARAVNGTSSGWDRIELVDNDFIYTGGVSSKFARILSTAAYTYSSLTVRNNQSYTADGSLAGDGCSLIWDYWQMRISFRDIDFQNNTFVNTAYKLNVIYLANQGVAAGGTLTVRNNINYVDGPATGYAKFVMLHDSCKDAVTIDAANNFAWATSDVAKLQVYANISCTAFSADPFASKDFTKGVFTLTPEAAAQAPECGAQR